MTKVFAGMASDAKNRSENKKVLFKLSDRQAKLLHKYGFKWYKNRTTSQVDPKSIYGVLPSHNGFIVSYVNSLFVICTIATIKKIVWPRNYKHEWIFVHWNRTIDIAPDGNVIVTPPIIYKEKMFFY